MIPAPILLLLSFLAGCASLQPASHVLQERIWDTGAERFVDAETLLAATRSADVTLLGETHDNPRHHEIQAFVLRERVAAGARPALAMEQIDLEWQPALDAARARAPTPEAIGTAAHVATASWKWPLYAPIVEVALAHDLPIVAINLSRAALRAASGALPLPAGWDDAKRVAMRELLVESHCGQDHPGIDRMVEQQRRRDAAMAEAIAAHAGRGVVAILGRGHARRDLGVPLDLEGRLPRGKVLSVGLVEVEAGQEAPRDYPEAAPGRHDYVWFTRREARPDPCAGLSGGASRPR